MIERDSSGKPTRAPSKEAEALLRTLESLDWNKGDAEALAAIDALLSPRLEDRKETTP